MASLVISGATNGLIKYTDDNLKVIRLVVSSIDNYFDSGGSILQVESSRGVIRMKLTDQAAVDAAIALLDSKF